MGTVILDADALAAAALPTGFDVHVVEVTGSTNADLALDARRGAPGGRVLVAENQRAGRGRLDRSWVSPAGAGLTFSVLLRPEAPAARLGWVPLLAGVALVDALGEQIGDLRGRMALKWPNDLLIDGRKAAGILAEAVPAPGGPPGIVVGIGLNVSTRASDLPSGATSIAIALDGRPTPDREALLVAILRHLGERVAAWRTDPDRLPAAYRSACATLGRPVRVEMPDGGAVTGVAEQVDADGRLVVDGRPFSAGDVVHLRAA